VDADIAIPWSHLAAAITAIGALGTAAFGLVDTLKVLPGGGISRAGFKFIRRVAASLLPAVPALDKTGLARDAILFTLQSQWINGTATTDQVNIAKSLIKLRLTPDTAPVLASATGVDDKILSQVAECMQTGKALTQVQSDVYGRFDLLLTTLLGQAYQRADQRYRNAAKFAAVPVAVVLALLATNVVQSWKHHYLPAILIGLIATPIAPIAKDLSTAISTAAQALQAWKK
jgi:hypothetical protein